MKMSKPRIYVALDLPGTNDSKKDWFMCDQISIYSGNPDEKCLMVDENGEEFRIYVKPSTFVYIAVKDNDWERSAKELLKDFPTAVWEKEN